MAIVVQSNSNPNEIHLLMRIFVGMAVEVKGYEQIRLRFSSDGTSDELRSSRLSTFRPNVLVNADGRHQ